MKTNWFFMKSINRVLGIGSLALALGGCGTDSSYDDSAQYQTIRGLPISVAGGEYGGIYTLAIVLDVEGRHVLARKYGVSHVTKSLLRNVSGVALVQSEISDGDEEPIELRGRYDGDIFEIKGISANDYNIDF